MLIVIVGMGKVGLTLTEFIAKENHDVVIIDIDSKKLENTVNLYDVRGVTGSGAAYSVQMEAGVNKADLLIAVTSSDELNILCCMIARRIGAKHTIARVRDPIYSQQRAFMRDELGMSMIVNPEFEAANEMSRILRFPSAIKIDTFAKGRVELAEIRIADGNPLDGCVLSELPAKYNASILVCAVQRDKTVCIPSGNFVLRKGDDIYITASHKALSTFFKDIGVYREKVKSVLIIGGSSIAYYLSMQLYELGIEVIIIEQDEKRCLELSDLLPDAKIINGDGTDRDLLYEEGIEKVDACVTLTGIDEENIIISMFAGKLKVPKIITKIDRNSFTDLLDIIGIDSVVSPKAVVANNILRYVRAMQNTEGSSVQTLYRLLDGKVEALEFLVSHPTEVTGKQLKDLKFKDNILVASIIRGNRLIYPHGVDTIEPGDSVVIITANRQFSDLDDILL